MSLVLTCDGCGKPIRTLTLEERNGWRQPLPNREQWYLNAGGGEYAFDLHGPDCLRLWWESNPTPLPARNDGEVSAGSFDNPDATEKGSAT